MTNKDFPLKLCEVKCSKNETKNRITLHPFSAYSNFPPFVANHVNINIDANTYKTNKHYNYIMSGGLSFLAISCKYMFLYVHMFLYLKLQ